MELNPGPPGIGSSMLVIAVQTFYFVCVQALECVCVYGCVRARARVLGVCVCECVYAGEGLGASVMCVWKGRE